MFRNISRTVLTQFGRRSFGSVKETHFGTEGRAGLARGIDILANAVAVTLGPKGRMVIIGKLSMLTS